MTAIYMGYLQQSLADLCTARQALVEYKNVNLKQLKNLSAYHIQQAIEHIIKYLIYNKQYNMNTSVKEAYTHDIDKLINSYCIPLKIDIPKNIKKNASLYTKWEAGSRYDLSFSVRVDTLTNNIIFVENWLLKIKPSARTNITRLRDKYKI